MSLWKVIISPPLKTKDAIVQRVGKGQRVWRLEEGGTGWGISAGVTLGASMGVPQGEYPKCGGCSLISLSQGCVTGLAFCVSDQRFLKAVPTNQPPPKIKPQKTKQNKQTKSNLRG